MLKELQVYSPQLSVLPFEIDRDATEEADLIQIKDITGLGPVSADINTSRSDNVNFEVFQDSSIGRRNIVITFGPNPNWTEFTYSDLRRIMETAFMPQTKVRMVFVSDDKEDVQISGYVESVDPSIFTNDPEYQVSILCPESDFVGMEDVVKILPVHLGLPYAPGEALNVDYIGTVPTGVILSIPRLDSEAGIYTVDFSFYQEYGGSINGMFVGSYEVSPDHDLRISTVPGDKYAKTIRDMPTPDTSVLPVVSTASQWTLLKPGDNSLRLGYALSDIVGYDTSIDPDTFANATMKYRNRYGSI